MKKKIFALGAALFAGVCALAAAGCSNDDNPAQSPDAPSPVNLVEVGQDDVGRVSGIKYYVVPEPAASAKVKALTAAGSDYFNSGSLQSLYGEGGYPQAVLVAKSSLVESDGAFIKSFLEEYADTKQWLSSQNDYAQVVAKITANGGTSLKAPALTGQSVANCNVDFRKAKDEKQNVLDYLNAVKKIEPNSYGACSDAFFADVDAIASTSTGSLGKVTVYMPDGAPALSMAKMMCSESAVAKSVEYKVVAANTINARVTANDMDENADLCVLPVNAAAKLLGSGEKYKLLGTVTHGNLFILSSDSTIITAENIAQKLAGEKVGVINLAAVPGLTFKMVLDKYGLSYGQGN